MEITRELLNRHILPHRKGYMYFKEAISLMRAKNGKIHNFVDEIYSPIANSHGVCVAAVIKSMTACMSEAVNFEGIYFTADNGRNSLKGCLMELYSRIFLSSE